MAYLNVGEIESALQNLAAAYPATTELLRAPNLSHEGRQIHVLRIGTKSSDEADGILILGGVHAREWVPPDALISLAADLAEAYKLGTGLGYGSKNSRRMRFAIMESLNLFVCACVNPDGRHYSQTNDPLWRKNRRPHPSSGNCVGVDLNRNFDFLWDHLTKFAPDSGVSASEDPCDKNVYRGPSAARSQRLEMSSGYSTRFHEFVGIWTCTARSRSFCTAGVVTRIRRQSQTRHF